MNQKVKNGPEESFNSNFIEVQFPLAQSFNKVQIRVKRGPYVYYGVCQNY